MSAFDRE